MEILQKVIEGIKKVWNHLYKVIKKAAQFISDLLFGCQRQTRIRREKNRGKLLSIENINLKKFNINPMMHRKIYHCRNNC